MVNRQSPGSSIPESKESKDHHESTKGRKHEKKITVISLFLCLLLLILSHFDPENLR
jgi:hypothetical protein